MAFPIIRPGHRYWTEEERAICLSAHERLTANQLSDLLVDRPNYQVGDYCRYIGVKLLPVHPPKPTPKAIPGPKSAWNDEREARATKLWKDGFSAAQIAVDLGCGVSRNGVIGKLHRLGLAGTERRRQNHVARAPVRMAASAPARLPRVTPTHAGDFVLPTLAGDAPTMRHRENIVANAKARVADFPAPAALKVGGDRVYPQAPPIPLPKEAAHGAKVVSLLNLGARHCRFPVGLPGHPDFGFCGEPQGDRAPYCDGHAKRCFAGVPPKSSKVGQLRTTRRCA